MELIQYKYFLVWILKQKNINKDNYKIDFKLFLF